MAEKKVAAEKADKNLGAKTFANRIEPGATTPPPPPDDMFNVEGRDPKFHYHWAEENSRRLQALERKGYEICPATSGADAKKKVAGQRRFLERALNDPKISKEDAIIAKELHDKMQAAPKDTLVNIPSHVLVRTPIENRRKIMEGRATKSREIEDRIKQDIHDLDKALQRSGKGGMKAFRELFDRIR